MYASTVMCILYINGRFGFSTLVLLLIATCGCDVRQLSCMLTKISNGCHFSRSFGA